jgi:hypothetical protein
MLPQLKKCGRSSEYAEATQALFQAKSPRFFVVISKEVRDLVFKILALTSK